jgi:hypothetical protein
MSVTVELVSDFRLGILIRWHLSLISFQTIGDRRHQCCRAKRIRWFDPALRPPQIKRSRRTPSVSGLPWRMLQASWAHCPARTPPLVASAASRASEVGGLHSNHANIDFKPLRCYSFLMFPAPHSTWNSPPNGDSWGKMGTNGDSSCFRNRLILKDLGLSHAQNGENGDKFKVFPIRSIAARSPPEDLLPNLSPNLSVLDLPLPFGAGKAPPRNPRLS